MSDKVAALSPPGCETGGCGLADVTAVQPLPRVPNPGQTSSLSTWSSSPTRQSQTLRTSCTGYMRLEWSQGWVRDGPDQEEVRRGGGWKNQLRGVMEAGERSKNLSNLWSWRIE